MKISELQKRLEEAKAKHGDIEITVHADGAGSNVGYTKYHDGEFHLFDKMYGDESWELCFRKHYGVEPS